MGTIVSDRPLSELNISFGCHPDGPLASLVTTNRITNVYGFIVAIMLLMYSVLHYLYSVGNKITTITAPLGTNVSEINQNSYIFIQENVFENVVWKMVSILSRPHCVNWTIRVSMVIILLSSHSCGIPLTLFSTLHTSTTNYFTHVILHPFSVIASIIWSQVDKHCTSFLLYLVAKSVTYVLSQISYLHLISLYLSRTVTLYKLMLTIDCNR